ncbi:MAG: helix-turn-helix domain-containing protein [Acidobacteria bacterium]|nr:helix-turn-helix domain-containing protein [Acidobacteriota bacterium]
MRPVARNIEIVQNIQPVLSTAQLAEAVGVSESSVKRWIDGGRIAASRTAGGHRRVGVEEAARYIRAAGLAVHRPERLGLPELSAYAGREDTDTVTGEKLFEHLTNGRTAAAAGLLQARFLAGASVAQLVDGPVSHAMTRVGELWRSSETGILIEHRTTETAIQAFTRLRALLPPVLDGPVAVGCAPSGDPYVLPSLAAAAVVEDEGFRAVNLGPETPLDTLAAGAEAFGARLVWISFSSVDGAVKLRRQVLKLAKRLSSSGVVLMVGGARVHELALGREKGVCVGHTIAELRAVAQGLVLSGHTAGGASEARS